MSITPLAFDATTAREIVGDHQARIIEAKARLDADVGQYSPPSEPATTYWGHVTNEMRSIVYTQQYNKRSARLKRKSADENHG